MAKYGDTAVLATKLASAATVISPVKGWKLAATEVFPDSPSSQDKGCPRGAFLGLCEEGLVKRVAPGIYTRSRKNKKYALQAFDLLCADPSLSNDPKILWRRVMDGDKKAHNSQMDVVIALWKMKLLRTI